MKIQLARIVSIDRARSADVDSSDFEALKDSIRDVGLIHPLMVYKQPEENKLCRHLNTATYKLVCGNRRLHALLALHRKDADCTVIPIPDEKTALLLELDENRRRKNFNWVESLTLKCKLFYKLCETDKTMTQDKFSNDVIRQSPALTSMELGLYEAMELPENVDLCLVDGIAKAYEELRRRTLGMLLGERTKRQQADLEAAKFEGQSFGAPLEIDVEGCLDEIKNHRGRQRYAIYPDAITMLKDQPDASADCCITDPPFGINLEGAPNKKGGAQIYEDDDTIENYTKLITETTHQLARVLKSGAHLYMFFSFKNYNILTKMLTNEGFDVYPFPFIWVKTTDLDLRNIDHGGCANPDIHPSIAYYSIMFAFNKGKKRTIVHGKRGYPNVITWPKAGHEKTHPLEIPGQVYNELALRSCRFGDTIIDPFCGTGNSISSWLTQGFYPIGAEKKEQFRKIAESKCTNIIAKYFKGRAT